MSMLTVVDGSNVVNEIGRFFAGTRDLKKAPSLTRLHAAYLHDWLDLDRFIRATLKRGGIEDGGAGLGTVIVRSNNSVGEGNWRLNDRAEVADFWARQGGCDHTSVMLVDLPSTSGGEKGIDTSIIVYLFETMDQWDTAILFTNDTDFVPAVWSLRRRGKRVYCVSGSVERTSPLVQASQHFIAWNEDFLRADFDLFRFLQPDGVLDQFLRTLEGQTTAPALDVDRERFGIRLDGQREPQPQIHRLNEMLASTSLRAEFDGGLGMYIVPRSSAGMGAAGIRRHLTLFTGAYWHSRFECSTTIAPR